MRQGSTRTKPILGSRITSLKPACLLLAAVLFVMTMTPLAVHAKVVVSNIFNSHMVLQQEMDVPVWGTADAGEEVTVTFADQTLKTKADADGKWQVKLKPLKATPNQAGQTLTIAGSNTITFIDVLIGEVWFCSGQSNMAMTVGNSDNATEEKENANYPQIRLFTVLPSGRSRVPSDQVQGDWRICAPKSAGYFSAAAYYFGRELHQKLGVPVGLINSSSGGTLAQAWTSGDALQKNMPEYAKLYEDMVHPGRILDEKIAEYNALKQQYDAALKQMVALEEDVNAVKKYAAAEFDDSSWKTMNIPGNWSGSGLKKNEQGMVWYRKTIDVPASMAGKDLLLRLGLVFIVDTAWFNGESVGQTGSMAKYDWNLRRVRREYRVPGNLVKAGRNVIALRISSLHFGGGLVSNPKENIDVRPADAPGDKSAQISLQGEWRFLSVYEMPVLPGDPLHRNLPSVLFNGMVHPFIPLAIRGVIWYQGESNVSHNKIYERLLTTLITDWRTRWGQGDFPFLVVQLPNFQGSAARPTDDAWTLLREAQAGVAQTVPNVGLAVTFDVGDARNIHPGNKQAVGHRLALIAESEVYGMKDVVSSGPTFKSFQVKGSEVHVSFDNVGNGLVQKGDKLEGFGLQDKNGKWEWADAIIQGDQVIVSSDKIKEPVGVSHAWSSNPKVTLFNKAGLPAAQFKRETK